MTAFLSRRRSSAARKRIVAVADHWRVTPEGPRREVVVQADGVLRTVYLPDEHPALVRYLERAAVAA